MKTFTQLVNREQPEPAESVTAFEVLDEQYEVLDPGAFWDETAEVLAPQAALSG